MTQDVDIAVIQDEETGRFDIAIDSDGDLLKTQGFDTAIKMSLHCERRASAAEVPVAQRRRGWWGNVASNLEDFEIGSKLWLLRQERLVPDVINRARDFVSRGLAWLVDEGFAVNTEVSVEPIDGVLRIDVTIERANGAIEHRAYDFWQNTGAA